MAPKADKAAAAASKQAEKTAKAVKKTPTAKKNKIRTSCRFRRPKTFSAPKQTVKIACPKRNKMDPHSIIQLPLTTESAMKKIEEINTLVFLCNPRASKNQIRTAVKKLHDITCAKINTLIRPDGTKKAYVKLTEDHDALDVANKIGII
uniref:Large ribosomal subunit protein uL23 N-terminal domain-containing protein n=1 Tax=Chromera velia CCMP2878 TaxID=1169474 RepID=A0A0G4FZF9_9ALVE|eukprot:Cvel_19395.t1-p1 / transcript=Cvel_19395.t1 / gene=Cvel_19395 / organism=Chromera_velia_CCMP2878 / gene_product=60S ribosomal protein L23a, putative / transcript_product=60S ribosomal protein L23a, putative / location=Cvel_scaffold1668:24987-28019(+) / protein_length=148 / sequence_SO=supercontig / SO=protein_coding / is_pseudo=false